MSDICAYATRNLSKEQHVSLCRLKRLGHKITVKPADKNLGIVLMDTNDYLQQCTALLSDKTTYKLTSDYPTTEIKRTLSKILLSFKQTLESYNKRLYKYLLDQPRNTRTPQFYGIPKIHKQYSHLPPMRPIVSQTMAILTPSAKLIDHLIQPLAQSYPTSLILTLQDLHVPDDAILVTSLYPSIPQSECLDTIYQEMYERRDLLAPDPNLIVRLLHLNMNYNYFKQTSHSNR